MNKLLLKLAFEAGRTFENRYNSFGLGNCIEGNDLAYAKGFGADFKNMKGDLSELSQLFATKGLNERKLKALSEPLDLLEELIAIAE